MLSLDKFVQLVERSKLIDPDRLAQVVADWKRTATLRQLDNALPCAEHLVDQRLLTDWQAKKLLEGRHRGFYLGKYKLLDHLGSGGMSSVYLAEHLLMQRRVAIKVLPQNRVADSSYLARFHLEAQAAAALDHRNIVRAYDLDNEGKTHYLVMEYIEGRDLHEHVAAEGPLDYYTAAEYVAQAATGLEHAHQRGLVHRDIKPANLLVDFQGTVKILDMGLAKFTAETRPTPGFAKEEQVLGTADYLAPEQAVNSQNVDARADIYALGCTLYFLLTGHPPFADGTSLERMAAHQQRVPPSVLLDRPDAPVALVAICHRMMEKSPLNRYQTASEAQRALRGWLDNEAALGRAPRAAVAGLTRGGGGPPARSRGPSKANLISDSAGDLPLSSLDLNYATRGLTDTDPNMQRATVKLPAASGRSAHDSKSAASAASESSTMRPQPPPVVAAPPSPPSRAEIETVAPPVQLPDAVPILIHERADDIEVPMIPDVTEQWLQQAHKASHASSWPWVIVLCTLVAAAMIAAIALL